MNNGHSDTSTHGIRVRVSAQFIPEQSDADIKRYAFAYRVHITNEGQQWAKLLSRRWVITDSIGEVEVVEGPGVVGEQPELEPGDGFEYMSGCPLSTSWGTMEGHYVMQREEGSTFEAEVGRFFLTKDTTLVESVRGDTTAQRQTSIKLQPRRRKNP